MDKTQQGEDVALKGKTAFVIAGNYDAFRTECNEAKVDFRTYKYIALPSDIYGHQDTTLYLVAWWYENRNWDDIDSLLQYCKTHNILVVDGILPPKNKEWK